MKLGYFTLGGFVASVLAKVTGVVDVTWGWVYAPLFVHLGGVIMMVLVYRQQQRAVQHFVEQQAAELRRATTEGETNDQPEP